MGALAAPEERQDAYAPLLMAAATELWGPTGGWQPGPPAPPPTPPPVVEFAFAPLPPVEFAPLPPVEFAPLPPVEFAPSTPVAFAAEVVAPALVAPRIPAQDATLAQGTTVAVVLRILVQDTDTTVAVATETLRWHWEATKDGAFPVLDMGALAAPEERQDAYALLMAAATELGGPTVGWQPGPPAPPTPPPPAPPPTPPPVVEFVAEVLPPALVASPAVVVAPRIPAQDATLAQGTTVAVVLRILVQDTDTTVAVAPHMSAPDTTTDQVVPPARHSPAAQDPPTIVQVVGVVASSGSHSDIVQVVGVVASSGSHSDVWLL